MGKLGDTLDSAVGLLDMLKKPPGSDPRYRGVAPDRTDMSFVRYDPTIGKGRGISARMQNSLNALTEANNPMRQEILQNIENGLEVGEDWYNTEELRDWFIMGHGPEEGHRQWAEYIDLVGATSPRSKVPPNIGNASAVRNRLYTDPDYISELQNVKSSDDAGKLAKTRPPGYGHLAGRNQEMIVADQVQGGWSGAPEPGVFGAKGNYTVNPKPKGFAQSLKGSEKNFAADMHFTRFIAMASKDPDWLQTGADVAASFKNELLAKFPDAAPYFGKRMAGKKEIDTFKPQKAVKDGVIKMDDIADYPGVFVEMPNDNEYKAFEDFMYSVGQELGLTGPQAQAALWMGAARKTKVDPTSQTTFMGAVRDRADIQAAKRGQTREQVLFDFIMNKGLLTGATAAPLGVLGLSGPNQAQAAPTENDLLQYLEANR